MVMGRISNRTFFQRNSSSTYLRKKDESVSRQTLTVNVFKRLKVNSYDHMLQQAMD